MSIVSYAVVFAIIGIVLHIVDIIVGKDWYRSLWDSSHKLPLPAGVTRGFITGRSTKERLLIALVITTIFAVLIYKLGDPNFLTLLGACFGIFAGLLIGFALGGFFKRRTNIEAATNKVLESLDKVDRGDLPDVRGIASGVAASAEQLGHQAVDLVLEQGAKVVDTARGAVTGEHGPKQANERAIEPPEPTKKGSISVADAVRKFNNRG